MKEKTVQNINELINSYNFLVKGIEQTAKDDKNRAYGGIIRAGKGILVESIARKIVEIAWNELNKDGILSFEKQTVKIPLNRNYIDKLKSEQIKSYILQNIKKFYYTLKTDVHVYVDKKFVIGIECKTFTENAMLKRILVDFTLFKSVFPELKSVLFQLESQLGGDYSEISKEIIIGSHSTHTLMSYFDVDLHILTLLTGERKVDKPIHKKEFFKELKFENVVKAVETFKNLILL